MTGSSWKSYLDPQIATRNRWADHRYARPGEVAEVRTAAGHGARSRGLAAAAAVALTVAAVVMFFVVALHSARPEPMSTQAPAAPAGYSQPAPSAGSGGGGHAVAQ